MRITGIQSIFYFFYFTFRFVQRRNWTNVNGLMCAAFWSPFIVGQNEMCYAYASPATIQFIVVINAHNEENVRCRWTRIAHSIAQSLDCIQIPTRKCEPYVCVCVVWCWLLCCCCCQFSLFTRTFLSLHIVAVKLDVSYCIVVLQNHETDNLSRCCTLLVRARCLSIPVFNFYFHFLFHFVGLFCYGRLCDPLVRWSPQTESFFSSFSMICAIWLVRCVHLSQSFEV